MKRILAGFLALLGLSSIPSSAVEPQLSQQDREDVSAFIQHLVWGGFESKEEIRAAASEQTQPPVTAEHDLNWIDQQIEHVWSKKQVAEAAWPVTTDWDRLDGVFKALEGHNVLALHNAGTTQSDSHGDAGQVWHDRGELKSSLQGFIYYHSQDVEGVLSDGTLYIGFATFPQAKMTASEIAERAVTELKKAGFKVTPPTSADERILITDIDWKKRSPQ